MNFVHSDRVFPEAAAWADELVELRHSIHMNPELRFDTEHTVSRTVALLRAWGIDTIDTDIVPGGMLFYDSSLIDRKVTRSDIKVFPIPATKMASDAGFPPLANMIVLGKLLKETAMFPAETIDKTIAKVVSARKQNLVELNKKAIQLGLEL